MLKVGIIGLSDVMSNNNLGDCARRCSVNTRGLYNDVKEKPSPYGGICRSYVFIRISKLFAIVSCTDTGY